MKSSIAMFFMAILFMGSWAFAKGGMIESTEVIRGAALVIANVWIVGGWIVGAIEK